MSALDTRIPPPLAGLLMGVVAWLASSAFAQTTLPFPVRLGGAIAFVVLGLALAGAGARTVSRAKTTLNPVKPETATALVTSGIYAYTRNPMYLGMAAWLLGWSAWLGTLAGLVGAPLFVLYMNRFQIGPEERALAGLFGAEFAAYRARVCRWL
ncbi:MAG: isoprenylcysteine carboxylmethyltransferase family protein [Gammaproteobacteria bacterium]|nr:isoprenylcysteine carboxylmethyltransferase family protein [Gammaproteobacteria bacterium]